MIRVLVVDDSAIVRRTLSEALSHEPDIQVVGTASDPYVAREKIAELQPDVLTLDIEMPRMDGLTFLEKLMKHHPMPVVVVSSLTPENSPTALRAYALGAIEVVSKPGSALTIPDVSQKLVHAIRAGAAAKIQPPLSTSVSRKSVRPVARGGTSPGQIIAIGASTGGPRAIETVLMELTSNLPGIVIVQHMPEHFTFEFAKRLDRICPMRVQEAVDGAVVEQGLAMIAPGNRHMVIQKSASGFIVQLKDAPPVNYHRPSVDVLFQSVARAAGAKAVGAILTGMGADGAKGLLAMREAGAFTISEHESTCVVYGMPKAAAQMGAACEVLPLDRVASGLMRVLSNSSAQLSVQQ